MKRTIIFGLLLLLLMGVVNAAEVTPVTTTDEKKTLADAITAFDADPTLENLIAVLDAANAIKKIDGAFKWEDYSAKLDILNDKKIDNYKDHAVFVLKNTKYVDFEKDLKEHVQKHLVSQYGEEKKTDDAKGSDDIEDEDDIDTEWDDPANNPDEEETDSDDAEEETDEAEPTEEEQIGKPYDKKDLALAEKYLDSVSDKKFEGDDLKIAEKYLREVSKEKTLNDRGTKLKLAKNYCNSYDLYGCHLIPLFDKVYLVGQKDFRFMFGEKQYDLDMSQEALKGATIEKNDKGLVISGANGAYDVETPNGIYTVDDKDSATATFGTDGSVAMVGEGNFEHKGTDGSTRGTYTTNGWMKAGFENGKLASLDGKQWEVSGAALDVNQKVEQSTNQNIYSLKSKGDDLSQITVNWKDGNPTVDYAKNIEGTLPAKVGDKKFNVRVDGDYEDMQLDGEAGLKQLTRLVMNGGETNLAKLDSGDRVKIENNCHAKGQNKNMCKQLIVFGDEGKDPLEMQKKQKELEAAGWTKTIKRHQEAALRVNESKKLPKDAISDYDDAKYVAKITAMKDARKHYGVVNFNDIGDVSVIGQNKVQQRKDEHKTAVDVVTDSTWAGVDDQNVNVFTDPNENDFTDAQKIYADVESNGAKVRVKQDKDGKAEMVKVKQNVEKAETSLANRVSLTSSGYDELKKEGKLDKLPSQGMLLASEPGKEPDYAQFNKDKDGKYKVTHTTGRFDDLEKVKDATFDEKQLNQLKDHLEKGDVAAAQKLINGINGVTTPPPPTPPPGPNPTPAPATGTEFSIGGVKYEKKPDGYYKEGTKVGADEAAALKEIEWANGQIEKLPSNLDSTPENLEKAKSRKIDADKKTRQLNDQELTIPEDTINTIKAAQLLEQIPVDIGIEMTEDKVDFKIDGKKYKLGIVGSYMGKSMILGTPEEKHIFALENEDGSRLVFQSSELTGLTDPAKKQEFKDRVNNMDDSWAKKKIKSWAEYYQHLGYDSSSAEQLAKKKLAGGTA